MNWTTTEPVSGVKYIVETNTGSIFPAHVINGTWWNYEKAFPIEGARRWIVYPDGGNVNDEIPIEVLFKYLHRDFKNMKEIAKQESAKVKQLKNLNKELVEDYNKLYEENKRLEDEVFKKDVEHQKEMEKLYEMIHQLSNERDRLKEQQTVPVNQPDPSKELLRENKQMKAFLRSIMNTCDTVRELEIA
jgi:hypothetical protein